MSKILYLLFAFVIYLLALPYLLVKSRQKKYQVAIPAKFFLRDNPPFPSGKIWFHSCSMGETRALKPLFDRLRNDDILLSVITNTGYETGSGLVNEVRYLPYELFLPFWIRPQKALLVMEAELWYMLFLIAKQKGAKTYLINARISDKSYENYKRFRFFYRMIFAKIDLIFAQSERDKQRLTELGGKNIKVIGNIKLVNLPKITQQYKKPEKRVITAGSTHESEEELILDAWRREYGKLIIVPRHPERFDRVYKILEDRYGRSEVSFHRWSQKEDFESDIILLDKMGELNNIYAISDCVILGGSFIETAGGHNPIEPAFFGCKLISGTVIFNQKSLFEAINDYYLINKEALALYLQDIDALKNASIGEKGTIEPIIDEIEAIVKMNK